jgi:hypothetical protein
MALAFAAWREPAEKGGFFSHPDYLPPAADFFGFFP